MVTGHRSKVIVGGENNNIADFFEQALTPNNGQLDFIERIE